MSGPAVRLSAVIPVHEEEARLAECLKRLAFADEIVVMLDRCRDRSAEIAGRFTDRVIEGAWPIEGERRNAGIDACRGEWVLEIDADQRVPDMLAREILDVIGRGDGDIFDIPVHNYVNGRLVRHGWMAALGTNAAPCLFRKGSKRWGPERVHPHLHVSGRQGPALSGAIVHHAARNVSDLLMRLDRNTTWRAQDLVRRGAPGAFAHAVRKIFSRFFKCYVMRKGYREDGYGFVIALCAALYPVLSHLKATLEPVERQ